MSTGDLFGFAEAQGRLETLDHLTVYPRVIPLTHVDLTSRAPHGTIRSQQPIFADPARVMGKREYQRGDPLRAIDWKSSAHANQLQVKKYEPAVSLNSIIFLDLSARAYTPQLRGPSWWPHRWRTIWWISGRRWGWAATAPTPSPASPAGRSRRGPAACI
jgi:uncharacterized protein (DUF58 family)